MSSVGASNSVIHNRLYEISYLSFTYSEIAKRCFIFPFSAYRNILNAIKFSPCYWYFLVIAFCVYLFCNLLNIYQLINSAYEWQGEISYGGVNILVVFYCAPNFSIAFYAFIALDILCGIELGVGITFLVCPLDISGCFLNSAAIMLLLPPLHIGAECGISKSCEVYV